MTAVFGVRYYPNNVRKKVLGYLQPQEEFDLLFGGIDIELEFLVEG